jgi:hypothetical protein
VTWSSGTPAVATVSATGVVTAVAAGSAAITATVEGVAGTAAVTVTPVPVATVSVTPGSSEIFLGGVLQLHATARDLSGNSLSGRTVTWETADSSIAVVSSTGLVSGLRPGVVDIRAKSEGVWGTSQITISFNSGSFLEFDGINDGIAVSRKLFSSPQPVFTIEAWIRSSSLTQPDGTFFSKQGELNRDISFYYRGGRLGASYTDFSYGTFVVQSASIIDLSRWTHVAWVKSTGVQRLFVNGVLVAEAATARDFVRWDDPSPNPPFHMIGQSNSHTNNTSHFLGSVARFKISSAALYSGRFLPGDLVGTPGSDVLFYRMSEGVGSTVIDHSGNGATGSIIGGTWRN